MSKNKPQKKRNVVRGPNNLKEKLAMEKTLAFQAEKNDLSQEHINSLWGDLDTLHQECMALRTSPSQAVMLLKRKDLIVRVKDVQALTQAAQVLAKDIADYTDKLATVYAMHSTRERVDIDEVLLGELLAVGEAYNEWITSYQLVVIPSAIRVSEFFKDLNDVDVPPIAPAVQE